MTLGFPEENSEAVCLSFFSYQCSLKWGGVRPSHTLYFRNIIPIKGVTQEALPRQTRAFGRKCRIISHVLALFSEALDNNLPMATWIKGKTWLERCPPKFPLSEVPGFLLLAIHENSTIFYVPVTYWIQQLFSAWKLYLTERPNSQY